MSQRLVAVFVGGPADSVAVARTDAPRSIEFPVSPTLCVIDEGMTAPDRSVEFRVAGYERVGPVDASGVAGYVHVPDRAPAR